MDKIRTNASVLKNQAEKCTKYLRKVDISHLSSSAINFNAKIYNKNSPWLYVRYIRTYSHGIFKGQKYCTLKEARYLNKHCRYSLTPGRPFYQSIF